MRLRWGWLLIVSYWLVWATLAWAAPVATTIRSATVAELAAIPPAANTGKIYIVRGALDDSTCMVSGGTFENFCQSTGSAWEVIPVSSAVAGGQTNPEADKVPRALGTGKLDPGWISDFVAAGASHASGGVPDPGAVAGLNRVLKDNGAWAALGVADLSNGVTGVGSVVLNDHAVLTSPTITDLLVTSIAGIDGTGTDQAGSDTGISAGAGTGIGKSGAVRLKTAYSGSSGSTPNVLTDRLVILPERVLTDAQTSLFEIALPAGGMTGGSITWCIEASDGADMQIYCGMALYAAVNKAGAYTLNITESTTNEAKAVSGGTLTASWGISSGTNKITVNITPAGSLIETTYRFGGSVQQHAPHAVTVLN